MFNKEAFNNEEYEAPEKVNTISDKISKKTGYNKQNMKQINSNNLICYYFFEEITKKMSKKVALYKGLL